MNASAQDARNGRLLCECGNDKTRTATMCARCSYLDGTRTEALVIEAIRGAGVGLSLSELAHVIGSCRVAMQKVTKNLMRKGRLRRYERDCEAITVPMYMHGRQVQARFGASTCWVYCLTERRCR